MRHLVTFNRFAATSGLALLVAMTAQPGVTASPKAQIISGRAQEEILVSQSGTPIYLDKDCQRTPGVWGTWQVVYRRSFDVRGQPYWFSVGKYQDGSSLLCISSPGYLQGQRLAASQLQSQFIGHIVQEGNTPSFLVTVNGGNGRLVMLTQYRLGLGNPFRPTLVRLKQWQGSPS